MCKKRKKKILSFLLVTGLMVTVVPIHAANEVKITKKKLITVNDKKDISEKSKQTFEKKITEKGKKYKLEKLSYNVCSEKYLNKKEKVLKVDKEPKTTIVEDNLVYSLDSKKKIQEVVHKEEINSISAYDDYDHYVDSTQVPSKKTVTVNGKVIVCDFSSIQQIGTNKVPNTITVQFEGYDTGSYIWNAHVLQRNDDIPPLEGYEDELLQEVGAMNGSKVKSMRWLDEPYLFNGLMYRNAIVEIDQVVPIFRANYIGQEIIPEETKTVYECRYTTGDPEGRMEYDVEVTAEYIETHENIHPVLVGAGIVILLGTLLTILIILAKKKGEKEKNE